MLPSVVSVLATSDSSGGEGSGVILTKDGLILTNNHVVEGATALTVRFNDGTTAKATVVGADATDDLAVIKAEGVSDLTPATLGTSADLRSASRSLPSVRRSACPRPSPPASSPR